MVSDPVVRIDSDQGVFAPLAWPTVQCLVLRFYGPKHCFDGGPGHQFLPMMITFPWILLTVAIVLPSHEGGDPGAFQDPRDWEHHRN